MAKDIKIDFAMFREFAKKKAAEGNVSGIIIVKQILFLLGGAHS